MDVGSLALALGSSLTAGLNLYITVLTLGLLHRFDFLALPDQLQVLANPWVLGVAAVMMTVEFVADKIPYVDNTWDAIHSFIRIPAGAILAASAIGDVPTQYVWIAGLVGGAISFSSHGAKATARLAVNSTPEPFSNWFLSLLEDGLSVTLLWLIAAYPWVALILSFVLVVVFSGVIYLFYKFFRMLFRGRTQTAGDSPA